MAEQYTSDALEGVLSVTLPNSREVKWRFAQIAKIFGILRYGVDPRKINIQALLKKYRGTPVMQEVLSKLFHERMDIIGATDVLRGIQSGLIGLEVTTMVHSEFQAGQRKICSFLISIMNRLERDWKDD